MSEMHPSRSRRAGNRGRHRHVDSPETRKWEEVASADWLRVARATATVTPEPEPPEQPAPDVPDKGPPPRPPWLDPDEYRALCELRKATRQPQEAT